jgi:hypothetical protein
MTTYWFRPKRYGYGATPVTWQGWAVIGAAVAVVLTTSLMLSTIGRESLWLWLALIAVDSLTIVALVNFSRSKTDGEWRWRWGDRR